MVELATDRSGEEPVQEIELGDLANEVAARARRRSGREVVVTVVAHETLRARPQMVTRAISNLIDNAVKYSPDGSPVEVVITGRKLEVRDHGAGIPAADLPHVFDRFYRSDAARTRPGSGLGLAIVKQVVERHGGSVRAITVADGGAQVGFELP
jgi:two-component system sensor histidine kinase MprB